MQYLIIVNCTYCYIMLFLNVNFITINYLYQCCEINLHISDNKCTGPNEEYKSDKKSCPPETCRSIIARYKCDSKDKGQPGCACKEGFLRLSLNSTCIPMEQCPELKNSPDYSKFPNISIPIFLKMCISLYYSVLFIYFIIHYLFDMLLTC